MGKFAKLVIYIVLGAILVVSVGFSLANELGDRVKFDIRIEGVEKTLYAGSFTTSRKDDVLNLDEALLAFSEKNRLIDIAGIEGGKITEINGEKSGRFGGEDGWYFVVNNNKSDNSLDTQVINNTDSIVLYYGMPPMNGMQFLSYDNSNIREGVVCFMEKYTYYVEVPSAENPDETVSERVVEETPIVGAKVTWHYDKTSVEFITDEEGKILISDASQRRKGSHNIQVEKLDENGCPLVVRLQSDYSVQSFEKLDEVSDTSFIAEHSTALLWIIMAATLAVVLLSVSVMMRNSRAREAKKRYDDR